MRIEQMVLFDMMYLAFGLIVCFLYRLFNKKTNKIQWIDFLIIFILVFVSSLRCNVGSDYYGYYLRYNGILSTYPSITHIFSTSTSILFDMICYFTIKMTNFRFAIFWVVSILIYLPLILYFRKTNRKPYIGLFIFIFAGFYLITNNIIRQSLAMVFVFIAYHFLKNKKMVKYILFIFLACLFHPSAIFAGILILLSRKINPSFQSLLLMNMIGMIGFVLFTPVMQLLDQFIPNKYLNYIVFNYGGMMKQTLSVVGYVLFYNIMAFILINHRKKIKEENEEYYKMISMIILAIPISIVAIKCWPINRVAIYLYSFIIVLLPVIYNSKEILGKLKVLISVLIIIWFAFLNIFGGDNEYYDYNIYVNTTPDYPRNIIVQKK